MSNASTINIDIRVDDKGGTTAVKKFGTEVESAGKKGDKSLKAMSATSKVATNDLGSLTRAAVVMSGGFLAVQGVVQGVFNEFKRGLSSIEDFNLTVAASAAYITTFSDQAKRGDLAGAFQNANEYAGQLATKLEMIDSKTIASGKDLQIMSETFVQHGVLLDINNQKQVSGFTNIATALALVTAGQNKDIQMRQEINALLMGQIRATDRLPKLLEAIDPQLKEHIALWNQEGTTIENVGKLLEGFSASTGNLDHLWATVGSTMETIHNRVLRGAFKPIFEDLLGLAKDINKSLMDAEGNLTPLAKSIQDDISGAYETARDLIKEYGGEVATATGFMLAAKVAQIAFNAAVNANPYVVAAGALVFLNEQMKVFNLNIGRAPKVWGEYKQSVQNVVDVMQGVRDADTGKIFTEQEQTLGKIKALQDSISGDKKWYEFSVFKDPAAEKQNIAEVTAEIERLKGTLKDASAADTDMQRERMRGGGEYIAQAPKISGVVEDITKKTKTLTGATKAHREVAVKTFLDEYAEIDRVDGELNRFFDDIDKTTEKLEELKNTRIDAALLDSFGEVDAANEKLQEKTVETTNVMTEGFGRAADDIQGYMADIFMGAEFSFDSILDIFKKMLAEMLAAIIMSGIKQAFMNMIDGNSATTAWGGLVSGMSGAMGGGSGGGGSVDASGAASGWGKVGGGLAVAGGAYGMYSGYDNMKKGNTGTGAVQIGLGAYSTYKGAVTLGVIEKGAATEAAKWAAAKVGVTATTTAAETAAYMKTAYVAGKGATAYGTFQAAGSGASSASSAGTAATSSTGASAGGGAAAGAAIGLAAFTVIKVAMAAWDKSKRVLPQNEIDTAGITASDLGAFSAGVQKIEGTILASLPSLAKYTTAVYDADTGILTATKGHQTMALQYNATAQAGQQWTQSLVSTAETTRNSILAANDFSNALGVSAEGMGDAAEAATQSEQAIDGLSGALGDTKSAANSTTGALISVGGAYYTADEYTRMLANGVGSLGEASIAAADAVSNSAGAIKSAYASLDSINYDDPDKNSSTSASSYSSHIVNPSGYDSPNLDYHAAGFVTQGSMQWGSHVIGEDRMEALIPLPNGFKDLGDVISRLNRIEAKQANSGGFNGKVQVFIGNKELTGEIRIVTDRVIADRQAQGSPTGSVYI